MLASRIPARRLVPATTRRANRRSGHRTPRSAASGPLAVLIGPEGGSRPSRERDALIALPFVVRLAMGPRIMRADTAAVAALTLVNAVLGDWK